MAVSTTATGNTASTPTSAVATFPATTGRSARRPRFHCQQCGAITLKWVGRCGSCGEWNTLVEAATSSSGGVCADAPAQPVTLVDVGDCTTTPTGLCEVDRVLGGGLVPGSVTLLGGEPGIGKSTLLLQIAAARAKAGDRVLYACAEESMQQVRLRAERLNAVNERLLLGSQADMAWLLAQFDAVSPDLVVVDSIQTVHLPDTSPGSVAQVRECAHLLAMQAKQRGVPVVLVGQVTKDGSLAGPKVLEHLVDTVLSFEGADGQALRMLRATKHRFGSIQELGLFEMTGTGLLPVADPSGLFLADRCLGVAGSVVAPVFEGRRPLLVELQALVARSSTANPRRSAQGTDPGRLAMILAVLERHLGLSLGDHDVFALALGGVRLRRPDVDLAVAMAVLSSATQTALPADLVVLGEVGLGGELRRVAGAGRLVAEAARLGFTRALLPASAAEAVAESDTAAHIQALPATSLAQAATLAGLRVSG